MLLREQGELCRLQHQRADLVDGDDVRFLPDVLRLAQGRRKGRRPETRATGSSGHLPSR
jgi:hypothetical protein